MSVEEDEMGAPDKVLAHYQEGRAKLYKASGLEKVDLLGKIYQNVMRAYQNGDMGQEAATNIFAFIDLLDQVSGNPLIKDDMSAFEKDLYEQPMFKEYVAASIWATKVGSAVRQERLDKMATLNKETGEKADKYLKKLGIEFKVKENGKQ